MEKTKDGRIVDKRVLINKIILKNIILKIKNKNNWSWKQFANKLNVSTQILSHGWLIKNSTMPLNIFKKIISLDNSLNKEELMKKIKILEPFWGQKLEQGVDKTKIINFPDIHNSKFAEFYGILLGDGCLFSTLKGFSISGDKILDKDYFINYIGKLIKELFGVYPLFYYSKNTRSLTCILYRKKAVEYISKLNFPIGFKHDLIIPDFIKKNNANLARCIRGIMDTDGSLSAHPNSKIMIHLSITDSTLKKDVSSGLIKLGIKHGTFNKGIMLYSQNAIKFCDVVGFSNLKNILKYKFFLKEGRVPKSKQVEIFIREKNRKIV